nr:transglycosylase domain-containing protein [Shimazuella soli]
MTIAAIVIGAGAGIVSAVVKDEKVRTKQDFDKELNSLFQTSYAYFQNTDKNGKPVAIGALRFDNDRGMIKKVSDVTPYLVNAFISVEDRDFYTHKGIVPRSIIRAAFQQAVGSEVTTGGSTLTQQLVKNIVLKNRKKDIERKANEIVLALRMEQMYSKDEILVYYMNSVFFGKGANGRKMYGVQAAAKGLFNKTPKELNLAQAAYIAGMVQRPNALNPLDEDPKNYKRGMKRLKLVLTEMLQNKKITKKQYDEAIHFNIKKSLAKPSDFDNGYEKYPFIMFAMEDEAAETLMEMDHLDVEQLSKEGKYRSTLEEYKKKAVTGGFRFYTTIDEGLYNAVNKAATKGLEFHNRTYAGKQTHEQLGATIINNKTGAVLAFVSGTESFDDNQKDHALQVPRQPGSSIKPLLVYGPAIEEGIVSPHSQILDEPIMKSDGSGYYKNANGSYKGFVTVQDALKWSYNIPAIKTFNALGHQKGFNYLKELNLPPSPKDGEAAAIGGATNGYTVEKMTAAFSTLANGGLYNKPYMISKVTDADGKVLFERKQNPRRVFSPQTAYQMTGILKTVLSGTAAYIGAQIPSGYEVAGKTGTTSDEKDLWFIGYTPEVTIGVWSGYDYNFPMYADDKFSKKAWANIFNAAIEQAADIIPRGTDFVNPGDIGPEKCGFECDKKKSYEDANAAKEKSKNKKKNNHKSSESTKPSTPSTPPPNKDENDGDKPPSSDGGSGDGSNGGDSNGGSGDGSNGGTTTNNGGSSNDNGTSNNNNGSGGSNGAPKDGGNNSPIVNN